MNCHSDKIELNTKKQRRAFTLMEVVMAVMIIGVIITSVMAVMNQCIAATIDSRTHTQAFEIVRNNMETLLAENKLAEKTEFGISDANPDIQWETLIETFTEPVTESMWLRAACSATYTDQDGEFQTVQLTHWLSEIPPALQKKLKDQEKQELELMGQYTLNTGTDPSIIDPTKPVKPEPPKSTARDEILCGYTTEELADVPFDTIWRWIREGCD
jgi:prepilin-type N-terminal cleavage/methylation domain-containing protein